MTSTADPLVGRGHRVETLVGRLAAIALAAVGAGLAVSAVVEAIDGGDEVVALLACAGGALAVGFVGLRLTAVPSRIAPIAVFAAVAWAWIVASVAGAVPFWVTGAIGSWYDALFESVSGFTCTGSSVMESIDGQSAGVLFWRNLTQWLGGMGLVVLAVAVLPALRVGGLELLIAEAPGPDADRLTPRISETAKRLWLLYAAFTAALALALLSAGVSLFDAVSYSFTALATGGFAPHDASVAHFDSAVTESVIAAGMIVGGANFALHWRAVTGDPGVYLRVTEARVYAFVLAGATGLALLLQSGEGEAVAGTFRHVAFNVINVTTSSGFGTVEFTTWAPGAQLLLLLLMIPGGMTGSTAGGLKLLRLQVLGHHAARELRRVRHPRAVVPVRLGRQVLAEAVVQKVVGFVVLYATLLLAGGVLVAALGSDLVTSFSGAASAIGNIGPALGEAGPTSNFLVYPAPGRVVLMILMLLGRLELFAVLFMFAAPARAAGNLRR